MRVWSGISLFVVLLFSACQPIMPEGSGSATQQPSGDAQSATVAEAEVSPTASISATVEIGTESVVEITPTTAITATQEAAQPSSLATETITTTQSAAASESVAPTEASQSPAAPSAETPQAEAPAELVAFGYDTYRKQYCGICHELEVAGTRGTFGPPHNHMGTIAPTRILESNYSGSATNAAEYLYESLVSPELFIVDGYALSSHRMPAYSFLSEAELEALVAFLLAQK